MPFPSTVAKESHDAPNRIGMYPPIIEPIIMPTQINVFITLFYTAS